MATHYSILAWRIPWGVEPGRLQSTGSQRVKHDWMTSLPLFWSQVYMYVAAAVVLSLHHVWLFWDPMDCSLPGSSVHGILQARILEWVAIPFSRECSQHKDETQVSCTAGRFFTIWATREDLTDWINICNYLKYLSPTPPHPSHTHQPWHSQHPGSIPTRLQKASLPRLGGQRLSLRALL